MNDVKDFIYNLPKAELHVHIEGVLEPELMFQIAERNKIQVPYNSIDELKSAYNFKNLGDFLRVAYDGQQVLRTEQDFFDLMMLYGKRASAQGLRHAEIFFEIQSYDPDIVPSEIIFEGLIAGIHDLQKKYGISAYLLLCFLRDRSNESAYEALKKIGPYREYVVGVGLAGNEKNNPPKKFIELFAAAEKEGLHRVAHAGEEGSAEYVIQALELLHVERIDHGIQELVDKPLMEYLAKNHIPLTVCPLSNVALKVVPTIEQHPIKIMMKTDLSVSINSDDPAYFGGYIGDNYYALYEHKVLSIEQLVRCARASFHGSFLPDSKKEYYLRAVADYAHSRNS